MLKKVLQCKGGGVVPKKGWIYHRELTRFSFLQTCPNTHINVEFSIIKDDIRHILTRELKVEITDW